MKKSILALMLAVVAAACMQQPTANNNVRNPDNEALVNKYTDALVAGRVDEMAGYLADGFKSYGPAMTDSADKATEIARWKGDWDSVYTSIEFDRYATLSSHIDSGRVAGDWVFNWGIVTLNFKKGKTPVKFWWHGVHNVRDGKIQFVQGFYDLNDILVQRGAVPPTPAD